MKKHRILAFLSCGMALIAIYLTAVATLPYINNTFTHLAVISAGISFPTGLRTLALELPAEPIIEGALDIEPVTYTPPRPATSTVVPPATAPTSPVVPLEQVRLPSIEQTISTVKPLNPGMIERKTYTAEIKGPNIPLVAGVLRNCTEVDRDTIEKTIKQKPKFDIKADGTPEVLIMHTHATESYQPDLNEWFSRDYTARTTDNAANMVAVGDRIENELKAAGIGVIHNRTLHDYPSYNGSYERSAITVKQILKDNPTIKVVLDIHRDAIQPATDQIISPVTQIDGKDCAQVMIISGCDNGKMNMPNYLENLKFASLLQTKMESSYKSLTRPILFDYRKYNQDLTTGSLLIEVGGHGNTLAEALYAGELIGKSLVVALMEL